MPPVIGRLATPRVRNSSSAAARRWPAFPIARTIRASPISRRATAAVSRRRRRGKSAPSPRSCGERVGVRGYFGKICGCGENGAPSPGSQERSDLSPQAGRGYKRRLLERYNRPLLNLRETVVERIAGAAHGADRILLAAGVEKLAQAADMHVHGALVDVDVAAPDAVEQLFAGKHPPGMLEKEFEQAVFGRPEIDGAAGAGDAALFPVELDIAIGEHSGKPLGARAAQQPAYPRQQFRHRERLDDVVVRAGR